MATTSRFEKFDSSRKDFMNWFERFSAFLESEYVANKDKVNCLISCIGAETYATLKK